MVDFVTEMAKETLTAIAEEQLSMFYRRFFQPSKGYQFLLVLSCTFFCLATCGPCSMKNHLLSQGVGLYNQLDYDACGSIEENYVAGLEGLFVGDISSAYIEENLPTPLGLENVCKNPEFFCFPSTLPGFWSEEHTLKETVFGVSEIQDDDTLPGGSVLDGMQESNASWLSDYGKFKLLNGRTVSCSLNFGKGFHDLLSRKNNIVDQNDLTSCQRPSPKEHRLSSISSKNSEMRRSGLLDGSSSHNVDISPRLLDWGQQYLYLPSLAFLTVTNTHNDKFLHVYEPFSTDTEFYPCDFDEMLLGPGEVASICFGFLPRRLGLSSAQLVLQTSSGGYLVHAKGLAIESPYGIQPLVGLDMSSNGRWSKNLSLFNPFEDTLYVEEVTAWISISSGNASHSAEALCRMDNFQDFDVPFSLLDVKERLDIKSGHVGLPLMRIRPHRSWKLEPRSTETIMEIDFSSGNEGKVYGVFCMQLQSSSQNRSDTVIVPLEAELHGKAAYSGFTDLISVSLETLVPCDESDTLFIALSLTNGAPYLLSVLKISEVVEGKKLFQIKYMEGLLLFPGTVTQIAVITCKALSVDSQDHPPEIPNINTTCKLLIVTNDSGSQIEIPCQDVILHCSKKQPDSFIGHDLPPEKGKSANTRTGTLGNGKQSLSQNKFKALQAADVDELVLRNWRSQGTTSIMSVLDDHEVSFPMVQVGTHYSKWIAVKNPSQHPVIMQLLLHSGSIIDQCRPVDEFFKPPSSSNLVQNEFTTLTGYGFSIAETAITEIYVHPYGRAILGPIIFHPSSRCEWKSSALIRNNLSGVEWLPLQGFGGTTSLVLLEGSAPVQGLEFNLSMPVPLTLSSPPFLFNMEDTSSACSQPLSKEIYAKNTGDLPLEVKRVEVSGTDCGLDGFKVHACRGFFLEPGESMRLFISYQTDFSTAVLYRDLELALTTGTIVIPMKASLPLYMLNFCKKSLFWMRLKKISLVIIVAACVMFMFLCCIHPQPVALDTQYYSFESERSSDPTIKRASKPFRMRPGQGHSRFSMATNMDGLIKSVGKDENSKLPFVGRYCDGPDGVQQGITQHRTWAQDDEGRNIVSDPQKEISLSSSSLVSSSVTVVQSSNIPEASESNNLTIKIGKRRERRRRKKKSVGAGLTGIFDVSSSQSGNSTPSSPLSPVTSSMPKQTWPLSPDVELAIEARNPFALVRSQPRNNGLGLKAATEERLLEREVSEEQPSAPKKTASKAVLLPSATFPCTGRRVPGVVNPSPFLASTSTIAPHERAPGSKLCNQKSVKAEEKVVSENEFTYDIWGNHLSGLHLMGMTKEFSARISNESEGYSMISNASDGDSESFFVRGPQTLVRKSQQARSMSSSPKLPYRAVLLWV